MKVFWVLCIVLIMAGCAGKGPGPVTPPQPPVDGSCGYVQNACLLGTPSGTDDTSSPYGWMCLGIRGGADASCSVPTASLTDEDEFFAGENDLVTRVKAAGPLRGKMAILDPTANDDGLTHASGMKQIVTSIGVPEENLIVRVFFDQNEWQEVHDQILVIGYPTNQLIGVGRGDLPIIKEHDILHVSAAGNTDTETRDIWYPEHPYWEWREQGSWKRTFEAFATGKLILATFARVDGSGNVSPNPDTVRCGLAMEYCYSVRKHEGWAGSSSATSALSALTFYLSQLWDTPQEVVGVLNDCAEDVGEPGIDEEYGRGIVSVVCDTVRNREVETVTRSLGFSSVSPVFSQMTDKVRSSGSFRPFFSVNGRTSKTMTGHLGGEVSMKQADLFLSIGTDYLPLGIRSSLLHNTRAPFMEFGTRRSVSLGENSQFSLLGTYGFSDQENLSARVGHLGAQYRHEIDSGTLSLDAGYRLVQGTVGIPGHREVGAAPVPFTDGNPEIRFSFTLR